MDFMKAMLKLKLESTPREYMGDKKQIINVESSWVSWA
jgi:hypothetical protein